MHAGARACRCPHAHARRHTHLHAHAPRVRTHKQMHALTHAPARMPCTCMHACTAAHALRRLVSHPPVVLVRTEAIPPAVVYSAYGYAPVRIRHSEQLALRHCGHGQHAVPCVLGLQWETGRARTVASQRFPRVSGNRGRGPLCVSGNCAHGLTCCDAATAAGDNRAERPCAEPGAGAVPDQPLSPDRFLCNRLPPTHPRQAERLQAPRRRCRQCNQRATYSMRHATHGTQHTSAHSIPRHTAYLVPQTERP